MQKETHVHAHTQGLTTGGRKQRRKKWVGRKKRGSQECKNSRRVILWKGREGGKGVGGRELGREKEKKQLLSWEEGCRTWRIQRHLTTGFKRVTLRVVLKSCWVHAKHVLECNASPTLTRTRDLWEAHGSHCDLDHRADSLSRSWATRGASLPIRERHNGGRS